MSEPNVLYQQSSTKNLNKRQIQRRKQKQRKISNKEKNQAQSIFNKWSSEITNNKKLSKNTKNKLYQVHRLSKKIEQNNLKLFKLRSLSNTVNVKPVNSTITQELTTGNNSEISLLERSNQLLQNAINKIENNILSFQSNLITKTKISVPRNIVRIRQLTQTLHTISRLFKTRTKLIKLNSAYLLSQNRKYEIQNKINQTANIFKNQNTYPENTKIHNFTNTKFETEFINLLNKGTNFIPTPLNFNLKNFKATISNEVKETLNKVINYDISKPQYSCKIKPSLKKPKANKKPYPVRNPIKTLKDRIGHPNFNTHSIDYVHETISLLTNFTQNIPETFQPINHNSLNIDYKNFSKISKFSKNRKFIFIKADKNLGWTYLPITWFINEYRRQLSDTSTYRSTPNINIANTRTNSYSYLNKIQQHFKEFLTDHKKFKLLNTVPLSSLTLPYMNIYPKVHKLSENASPDNLKELKGRPIITAHSWITSNPSRLLGSELDTIINKLQNFFLINNLPFPILKNSEQLIKSLNNINLPNIDNFTLTSFDFSSLYTNISYQDTINAIINSCKILNLTNKFRDYLLNLNNFINKNNFFRVGNSYHKQIKGVAMGSYHSRQIADLVLLLSEFNFLKSLNNSYIQNNLIIFFRYIDDGLLLCPSSQTKTIINKLCKYYPKQIEINFLSNSNEINYLDITISFNHYTLITNKPHYRIYQKPHHKYMYPHFNSNHPKHVFPGLINTETLRYNKLSATKTEYDFIKTLFFIRLSALNYPSQFLVKHSQPWLNNKNFTNRKSHKIINPTLNNTIYYRTFYNKHVRTDIITKSILKKYHNKHLPKLRPAICTNTKLHTLFNTNKKFHRKLFYTTNSN